MKAILIVALVTAQVAFPRIAIRMESLVQQIECLVEKDQSTIETVFVFLCASAAAVALGTTTAAAVDRWRMRHLIAASTIRIIPVGARSP